MNPHGESRWGSVVTIARPGVAMISRSRSVMTAALNVLNVLIAPNVLNVLIAPNGESVPDDPIGRETMPAHSPPRVVRLRPG